MSTRQRQLRVGMVGYAFMGAAHSQAWRTVNRRLRPAGRARMVRCLRPGRRAKVRRGRDRLGWDESGPTGGSWSPATTSTSSTSAPRATPTPRSPSPRWPPASTCCARSRWPTRSPRPRRWPRPRPRRGAGRAGDGAASTTAGCPRSPWRASWSRRAGSATIRHVRAVYLQDWIVDPEFPLVWRLQREQAGSGALGDIGAHIVDLTQFVTGQRITGVSALTETFVKERPLPAESSGLSAPATADGREPGRSPSTTPRCSSARLVRRRAGHVRGDPVRHRPQERAAGRDQRLAGQPGVRPRAPERAGVLRRAPDRAPSRASAGSWSPSPTTRTCRPGGRRATCSATSTPSPTRRATCIEAIAAGTDPSPSLRGRAAACSAVLAAVEQQRRRTARHGPQRRPGPTPRSDTMTPTDHAVHRPVGRPAVRGGLPAGLRVGLRRPGDRLLGRPLRGRQGARRRLLRRPQAGDCWPSTT